MSDDFKCEVCGVGLPTALFRQNKKGEPGIWRCQNHNEKLVDPVVAEITQAVEQNNG